MLISRLFMAMLIAATVSADEPRLIPVAPGWANNTVNVTIFRHAPIVTHEQTQFIAFYDPQGNVVLGKRKLDSADWELKTTQYKGNTKDAHNVICIGIDGDGYLHVSWDHHGNPLRYARSMQPLSLELTDKLPMTGKIETNVTYPEYYSLADGGLLFLYRDGASGRGNLVMNRYDVQSKQWTQLHSNLIDGENQRNAYWQATTGSDGSIHLSWVWRETGDVATNHDLAYAKSMDGGKTWQKSTGEKYTLPINAANAEYAARIPQKHELINQTAMSTDSEGNPFIATYWREEGADVPQYHIVFHTGKEWKVQQVSDRKTPFRLGGGGTKRIPISRPRILADTSGEIDKAYLIFRDEERGSKVSACICDDLSKGIWKTIDLTTESVGHWEPSYDPIRWQRDKVMNIFVQKAEQRDGEGVADVPPEMVNVLEWKP